MSYLEYNVTSVPSGLRKILYLNWPLIILLTAVASIGFLMLYSVAGGSLTPWAEPQMKRFGVGMVAMLIVAMVPIWFWRNMSALAYAVSLGLLLLVELIGVTGMGAQRWIDLGFFVLQPSELENHVGDGPGRLLRLAAISRRSRTRFGCCCPLFLTLFPPLWC